MSDDLKPWQQRILDEIDAKQLRAPRSSVRSDFHIRGHGLVLAAARARGMSIGAYVRRAAIAFAVHDLGADWDDVNEDEARIGERGGVDREKPRGRGFGRWRITGLRE